MTANQIEAPGDKQRVQGAPDYSSAWERLAFAAGIGFVALLFITISTAPEQPTAWAKDAKLAEWLVTYQDIFLVNAYLRSVAAFLMLIFICGVLSRVLRAVSRLDIFSLLALGGAVAFTLVMFISQMADTTAVLLAVKGGEPVAVRALAALGDTMRHFNSFSVALMIGASSAALLRARAAPRPVGWFGIAVVPVFLAGAAGFPNTRLEFINSTVALPLLPLWPLVLSVTLLWRSAGNRAVDNMRSVKA